MAQKHDKRNTLKSFDVEEFDFSDKLNTFMYLFSQQDERTRKSILNNLPAYNSLLSMESETFEEIELRRLAQIFGIKYDKENPPVPDCPFCGNRVSVTKKTGYQYRCKTCNRTFSVNYNSIVYGSKCDALTWMKVFQCMLSFTSITKTCEICNINKKTYYLIRNRIFYGLQLLMDRVKLYGEIQVDNTFVRMSYKGMNLNAIDVPEDSVFYEDYFKARPGRKRGGRYLNAELNANNICIFTAIDDRGHVLARFTGIGIARFQSLCTHIPSERFLLDVCDSDPFQDLVKPQSASPKTTPGNKSIMVADKEGSIEKYAKHLGVSFESHVFRKDGIQRQLADDARNIQRVNALHKRLKDFLRNCGYVSTKYLPGYLLLFEFIETTGCSQKAINALFQILATPNLGKSPSYYEEMYSVPNYLEEWLDKDNPVKQLPYYKRLAFYLYDHIRHKEEYPGVIMTMEYIEKETNYTAPTIRKFYKDLDKAGYRELILNYFGEVKAGYTRKMREDGVVKTRKIVKKEKPKTLNPVVLSIYDEYAKIRLLPKKQRPIFADFLAEKNAEYGTNYKRTNMLAKFKEIEESGLREPLPDYNDKVDILNDTLTGTAVKVSLAYDALKRKYREVGEPLPKQYLLLEELEKEFNLSPATLKSYISIGHKHRDNHVDTKLD